MTKTLFHMLQESPDVPYDVLKKNYDQARQQLLEAQEKLAEAESEIELHRNYIANIQKTYFFLSELFGLPDDASVEDIANKAEIYKAAADGLNVLKAKYKTILDLPENATDEEVINTIGIGKAFRDGWHEMEKEFLRMLNLPPDATYEDIIKKI